MAPLATVERAPLLLFVESPQCFEHQELMLRVMEWGGFFGGGGFQIVQKLWGKNKNELNPIESFLSGCVAGAFSQTFTFPFDVIKKKLQASGTFRITCVLVTRACVPPPSWWFSHTFPLLSSSHRVRGC